MLAKGNTRVQVAGRKSVKLAKATLLARNNGYRQERIVIQQEMGNA